MVGALLARSRRGARPAHTEAAREVDVGPHRLRSARGCAAPASIGLSSAAPRPAPRAPPAPPRRLVQPAPQLLYELRLAGVPAVHCARRGAVMAVPPRRAARLRRRSTGAVRTRRAPEHLTSRPSCPCGVPKLGTAAHSAAGKHRIHTLPPPLRRRPGKPPRTSAQSRTAQARSLHANSKKHGYVATSPHLSA